MRTKVGVGDGFDVKLNVVPASFIALLLRCIAEIRMGTMTGLGQLDHECALVKLLVPHMTLVVAVRAVRLGAVCHHGESMSTARSGGA
jgi:hypothetical protein